MGNEVKNAPVPHSDDTADRYIRAVVSDVRKRLSPGGIWCKLPVASALLSILDRWAFFLSFVRAGNVTDWKGIRALALAMEAAVKRVALDTLADGKRAAIVNRTCATTAEAIYAALVHAVILAWRDESYVPSISKKTGKAKPKRLIDAEFTSTAQALGLVKVATKDAAGNDTDDESVKVWFGASLDLAAHIAEWSKTAPPLPPAFIGTPDSSGEVGVLQPAASLIIGTESIRIRVPMPARYTAACKAVAEGKDKSNKVLDYFEHVAKLPGVSFDLKDRHVKSLMAWCEERANPKAPDTPAPTVSAPDSGPVPAPTAN